MTDASAPVPIGSRQETYATLVQKELREMILDGRLPAGSRINEVELAEAFQVSRGPLREAVQRLYAEGLLVAHKHRGAFVRNISATELRNLYSVRIGLETWALRSGARDANSDQLDGLRILLDETKSALRHEAEYPRDLDFHRHLVGIADNERLSEVHESVLQQIQIARSKSARQPLRASAAIAEHEQVLVALLEGRIDDAIEALETHLWASLESADLSLQSEPKQRPTAP